MNNLLNESVNLQPRKSRNTDPTESFSGEPLPARQQTLRECVTASLSEYFDKVNHEDISNLYELVLSEVEAPLLQTVMQRTRSNQSKASAMLGLNRGTLRKKLKKYGMLN